MPLMERKFADIMEDCLARLDRGEMLLDVLGVYPALEAKLRPLLLIAMLGRALPQPAPKPDAIRKGKNRMLAEMNRVGAEKVSRRHQSREPVPEVADGWSNPFQPDRVGNLKLSYRLAIVAVVLVVGGSLLTLDAAASGPPGGVLGNLFAGLERVRTALLFNEGGITDVIPEIEATALDDNLAGKPEDPSLKPGYDPSAYTDRVIPGLDGFNLSSEGGGNAGQKDSGFEAVEGKTGDPAALVTEKESAEVNELDEKEKLAKEKKEKDLDEKDIDKGKDLEKKDLDQDMGLDEKDKVKTEKFEKKDTDKVKKDKGDKDRDKDKDK